MRRALLLPWILLGAGCATSDGTHPPAPSTSSPQEAPAGPTPDDALTRQMIERARAREARLALAAWGCAVERRCEAARKGGDDQRDLEMALELLSHESEGDADRLAWRMAARVALDVVTREADGARARAVTSLLFFAAPTVPLSLADLPLALVEAPPPRRAALLAAAAPAVDELLARAPLVDDAGLARSGRSTPALLALRAGLGAAELERLADDVLRRTDGLLPPLPHGAADVPALLAAAGRDLDPSAARRGALVGAIAAVSHRAHAATGLPQCFVVEAPGDVRVLETADGNAAQLRYARACAAAAAGLSSSWDPLWVHTVATLLRDAAWLRSTSARDREAAARRRAAWLLDVRHAAASVKALLARPDRRALDELASSWASPGAAPVEGASALLLAGVGSAAADRLVAHVVAAAIDGALAARDGPGWAASDDVGRAGAELELLGVPWHEGGPRAVLRALGFTSVDGSAVVARAERLKPAEG